MKKNSILIDISSVLTLIFMLVVGSPSHAEDSDGDGVQDEKIVVTCSKKSGGGSGGGFGNGIILTPGTGTEGNCPPEDDDEDPNQTLQEALLECTNDFANCYTDCYDEANQAIWEYIGENQNSLYEGESITYYGLTFTTKNGNIYILGETDSENYLACLESCDSAFESCMTKALNVWEQSTVSYTSFEE